MGTFKINLKVFGMHLGVDILIFAVGAVVSRLDVLGQGIQSALLCWQPSQEMLPMLCLPGMLMMRSSASNDVSGS